MSDKKEKWVVFFSLLFFFFLVFVFCIFRCCCFICVFVFDFSFRRIWQRHSFHLYAILMRKWYPKLFLTILLLWALLLGTSKLYDFCIEQNCNLKLSYVLKSPVNADILFHGPCEPLWMVNPHIIDSIVHLKSYNIALSHSDFADSYLHLYFYLTFVNFYLFLLCFYLKFPWMI